MEKKYKLLKDLPHCKAGSIFTHESNTKDYYNTNGAMWHNRIRKDIVESKPDWFQEIVEKVWPKGILVFENADGEKCHNAGGQTEAHYQSWCNWHFIERPKKLKCKPSIITRVQNSSGEVFSVGDEVESDKYSIISFMVHEGDALYARITPYMSTNIDYLEKPSAPKTFTKSEIEAAIEKSELWTFVKDFTDAPVLSQTSFRKALGI